MPVFSNQVVLHTSMVEEALRRVKSLARGAGRSLRDLGAESTRSTREFDRQSRSMDRVQRSTRRAQSATDRHARAMRSVRSRTDEAVTATDRYDRSLNRTSTSMGSIVGRLALLTGGLLSVHGALGKVRESINVFQEWQLRTAGVQAVSQATRDEIALLAEQSQQLGKTTIFTARQAAEAQENLARGGLSVMENLRALPQVLAMAAADEMALADASEILIGSLRGFHIAAEDAQRPVDVLAKTSAIATTNISEAGEALKFAAPIASSLGVSIEDTAAAIALLADNMLRGTMGGTSFKQAMVGIIDEEIRGTSILNDLNISVGEFRRLISEEGLVAGLELLKTGMGDLTQAIQVAGARGGPGLQILLTQIDRLAEKRRQLEDITGTAQRMADIKLDTVAGDVAEMRSAFEGLQLTFGQAVEPALRSIQDRFTEFFLESGTTAEEWGEQVGDLLVGLTKLFFMAVDGGEALAVAVKTILALKLAMWLTGTANAARLYSAQMLTASLNTNMFAASSTRAGAASVAAAGGVKTFTMAIAPLSIALAGILALVLEVNEAVTDLSRDLERDMKKIANSFEDFGKQRDALKIRTADIIATNDLERMRELLATMRQEERQADKDRLSAAEKLRVVERRIQLMRDRTPDNAFAQRHLEVNPDFVRLTEEQGNLIEAVTQSKVKASDLRREIDVVTQAMRDFKAVTEEDDTNKPPKPKVDDTLTNLLTATRLNVEVLEEEVRLLDLDTQARERASDALLLDVRMRSEAAKATGALREELRAAFMAERAAERVLAGAETIKGLNEQITTHRRLADARQESARSGLVAESQLESERLAREAVSTAAEQQRAAIEALIRVAAAEQQRAEAAGDLQELREELRLEEELIAAHRQGAGALALARQEQEQDARTRTLRNRLLAESNVLSAEQARVEKQLHEALSGRVDLNQDEVRSLEQLLERVKESVALNKEQLAALDQLHARLKDIAAVRPEAVLEGQTEDLREQLRLVQDYGISAQLAADAQALIAEHAGLELDTAIRILLERRRITKELETQSGLAGRMADALSRLPSLGVSRGAAGGIDGPRATADLATLVQSIANMRRVAQASGAELEELNAEGVTMEAMLSQATSSAVSLVDALGLLDDKQRQLASTLGALGGLAGSFFGPEGASIGQAAGQLLGVFVGGLRDSAERGKAEIDVVSGRFASGVLTTSGKIRDSLSRLVEGVEEELLRAVEFLGGRLIDIAGISVRQVDDSIEVMVNGFRRRFEDVDDAIAFAVSQALRTADVEGLGPVVQQVLQRGFVGDLEDLREDLEQALAIERLALPESARGIAEELQAVTLRFDQLAESAVRWRLELDKVRDVGGSLGEGFQRVRDSITGVVKDERTIFEEQREIFNAELRLERARLSAREAALVRQIQLAELQASTQEAQLGVQAGLLESQLGFLGLAEKAARSAGVALDELRLELEAIRSALASLPEEIGAEEFRPRGGGGGRVRETRDAFMDRLLGSVGQVRAETRQWAEDLGRLEHLLSRARISQEQYEEALQSLAGTVETDLLGRVQAINERLGRSAEADAAAARLEEVRFRLQVAELAILAEQARLLGLLDETLSGLIDETLGAAREALERGLPDLDVPDGLDQAAQDLLDLARGLSEVELEVRRLRDRYAEAVETQVALGAGEQELAELRRGHLAALDELRDSLLASVQQYLDAADGIGEFDRRLLDLRETFRRVREGLTTVEDERRRTGLEPVEDVFIESANEIVAGVKPRLDEVRDAFIATADAVLGQTQNRVNGQPANEDVTRLAGSILETSDATSQLTEDMERLERAERLAVQALGIDFINSLDQLGISLPTETVLALAEAQFRLNQAQALATALALAAEGAFDGLAISLDELLGAIAGAEFDPSRITRQAANTNRQREEDRLDAVRDRLLEQIIAWERLPLGDVTHEAIALRETLAGMEADAQASGTSLNRLRAAFRVAVDDFVDDALVPFENLELGDLERELAGIRDEFVDLLVAFDTVGASASQVARLQESFVAAVEDFSRRAKQGIRDLLDELEGRDPRVSGAEQFRGAQAEFRALLGRARGGDLDAVQELANAGSAFEAQLRAFLGGGVGFNEAFQELLDGLREIEDTEIVPDDIRLLQEQADALRNLVVIEERQPTVNTQDTGFARVRTGLDQNRLAINTNTSMLRQILAQLDRGELKVEDLSQVLAVLQALSRDVVPEQAGMLLDALNGVLDVSDDLTQQQLDAAISVLGGVLNVADELAPAQLSSLIDTASRLLSIQNLSAQQKTQLRDMLLSLLDLETLTDAQRRTIQQILGQELRLGGFMEDMVEEQRILNARMASLPRTLGLLDVTLRNLPQASTGAMIRDESLVHVHAGERILSPAMTAALERVGGVRFLGAVDRALGQSGFTTPTLVDRMPAAPVANVSVGVTGGEEEVAKLRQAVERIEADHRRDRQAVAQLQAQATNAGRAAAAGIEAMERRLAELADELRRERNQRVVGGAR